MAPHHHTRRRAPRGGGHSFYPHSIFLTPVQRMKLRRGLSVQLHRDSVRKPGDREARIVHLTHTQVGMLHRAWEKGKSHRIKFSQRQLEHNARQHHVHGRGIFDNLKNAFDKAKNVHDAIASNPVGKLLLDKAKDKAVDWGKKKIQSKFGGKVGRHQKHHHGGRVAIPNGSAIPTEIETHYNSEGGKVGKRKGKGFLSSLLGLGIQAPGYGGSIPDGSGVPAYGHSFGKGISAPGGRIGHKKKHHKGKGLLDSLSFGLL